MAKHDRRVPPLRCMLATGAAAVSPLLFVQPSSGPQRQLAPGNGVLRGSSTATAAAVAASATASAAVNSSKSTAAALGAAAVLAATAVVASGAQRRARVVCEAARGPKQAARQKKAPPAATEAAAQPAWSLDGEIGATLPLGAFDPLGFASTEGKFRRMREAEVKHGRVAMMASIGLVGQHYLAVKNFPQDPGMAALIFAAGIMEVYVWKQDVKREPGDFGDPLGLNMYTEDMRNKEINNGRMAMMSCFGIWAAQVKTGKDCVEQLSAVDLPVALPTVSAALPQLPSVSLPF